MPAAAAILRTAGPAPWACRRVSRIQTQISSATCWFSDQHSLELSPLIASFIHAGDEIEFDLTAPLPLKECRLILRRPQRSKELYFGSIGYVAQPKADKRGEYFLRADVSESRLGAWSETDSHS
jgi:hypothetical protein